MKRLLWGAIAAVGLYLAVGYLREALRTDEERIARLLDAEVESFNAADLASSLRSFAEDYRDDSAGLDRAMLLRALLYAYQSRRDTNGAFRHRCAIDVDAMGIEVDESAAKAEAHFPLTLYATRDADAPVDWRVDVTASLEVRDGAWRIVRSRHETQRGKRPW